MAVVTLDDAGDNGQAQPASTLCAFAGTSVKPVEDIRQVFLDDARSLVGHFKCHGLRATMDLDSDDASLG